MAAPATAPAPTAPAAPSWAASAGRTEGREGCQFRDIIWSFACRVVNNVVLVLVFVEWALIVMDLRAGRPPPPDGRLLKPILRAAAGAPDPTPEPAAAAEDPQPSTEDEELRVAALRLSGMSKEARQMERYVPLIEARQQELERKVNAEGLGSDEMAALMRLRGFMGDGDMKSFKERLCKISQREDRTRDPAVLRILHRAGLFEQLEGDLEKLLEMSKEFKRLAVEIGAAPEANRAGLGE